MAQTSEGPPSTLRGRPGEKLRCVVVTPEKAVLDTHADFVVVPLYDGELGALPQRAPLIGRLGYGELRLKQGDTTQRLFVDGGFVQIKNNEITVLTVRAVPAEKIDVPAVTQMLEDSLRTIATGDAQDQQLKQQDRARVMLRIAAARSSSTSRT